MDSSPENVQCPASHLGCGFVSSSVEDSVRHYKEECKFGLVLCTNCGTQVNLFPSLYFLKQWCSCKMTSPPQDQQGSSKSVLEQLQSVQQEQRSFREWMKEWTAGLETRMMKTVEERVNTKLDALTERMEHLSKNEEVMRKLTHMDDTLQDTNAAHEILLAQLRADVRASKNKQDHVLAQVDQASKATLQELKDSKELSLRNVEEFARDKFDLLSNKVDEVKEEISRMTNAALLTELNSVVRTSNAPLQNLLTKLSTDFLAVKETLEDNLRKIDRVAETALCTKQIVESLAKDSLDLKKSAAEVKMLASEIPGIKEDMERVNVLMREVPALKGIQEPAKEVCVLDRRVKDEKKLSMCGAEEAKESSKAVSGVSGQRSWMGRVGTWVQGNKVFWYVENISEVFREVEVQPTYRVSDVFHISGRRGKLVLSFRSNGDVIFLDLDIKVVRCPDTIMRCSRCTASLIHPDDTSKNENVVASAGYNIIGRNSSKREALLCTIEEVRRKGFIKHNAICISVEFSAT